MFSRGDDAILLCMDWIGLGWIGLDWIEHSKESQCLNGSVCCRAAAVKVPVTNAAPEPNSPAGYGVLAGRGKARKLVEEFGLTFKDRWRRGGRVGCASWFESCFAQSRVGT